MGVEPESAGPRRPARPPQVIAAGVIELTLGSLLVAGATAAAISVNRDHGHVSGLVWFWGVQGALDCLAGVLVLRLRPVGRSLAVFMAAFGGALAALNIADPRPSPLILFALGMTLRILVIVFLSSRQARTVFGPS